MKIAIDDRMQRATLDEELRQIQRTIETAGRLIETKALYRVLHMLFADALQYGEAAIRRSVPEHILWETKQEIFTLFCTKVRPLLRNISHTQSDSSAEEYLLTKLRDWAKSRCNA